MDTLQGEIGWDGMDRTGALVSRNREYIYRLSVQDTLGRQFTTPADSVFLRETRTLRRWEMFGAAQFAQVKPVYEFYWNRLMEIAQELEQNPDMRVRFEGHACAIGKDSTNRLLSVKRAQNFIRKFKEKLVAAYPHTYSSIWERIDLPVGYGERIPLTIQLRGQVEVLFGDNRTPVGRYLNRRIMVKLYSVQHFTVPEIPSQEPSTQSQH